MRHPPANASALHGPLGPIWTAERAGGLTRGAAVLEWGSSLLTVNAYRPVRLMSKRDRISVGQ